MSKGNEFITHLLKDMHFPLLSALKLATYGTSHMTLKAPSLVLRWGGGCGQRARLPPNPLVHSPDACQGPDTGSRNVIQASDITAAPRGLH